MPEVSVEIAGRSYRLGCGEGEEEHLTGLANLLNTEATKLARQFGQMSEGRLMLMTALMIADRLAETESALHQTEQGLAKAQKLAASRAEASDMFGPEREREVARRLTLLAEKIEEATGARG